MRGVGEFTGEDGERDGQNDEIIPFWGDEMTKLVLGFFSFLFYKLCGK